MELSAIEFDCPKCGEHHRLEPFAFSVEVDDERDYGGISYFPVLSFRCPSYRPGPGRPARGGQPWISERIS